jgi:hypothetical protein
MRAVISKKIKSKDRTYKTRNSILLQNNSDFDNGFQEFTYVQTPLKITYLRQTYCKYKSEYEYECEYVYRYGVKLKYDIWGTNWISKIVSK